MSKLIDTLQRFNRKERFWLLHNALHEDNRIYLGCDFIEKLKKITGFPVPENAWWAMDYHLDWLIGALHLHNGGQQDQVIKQTLESLIKGTQEDMDLVVAFGNTLILIEAKGDTNWGNTQLNAKINRLEDIDKNKLLGHINFKFVLMSPEVSNGIKRNKDDEKWPDWMVDDDGKPLWFCLKMGSSEPANDFLKVIRCTETGESAKGDDYWKIQKAIRNKSKDSDESPRNNFEGKVNFSEILKKCEDERDLILVGFDGGIEKLMQQSISVLEKRRFKWAQIEDKGHKNPKNWIKGNTFLEKVSSLHDKG